MEIEKKRGIVIDGRLSLLRESMKSHGIDAYYVPTQDYHLSEYVSDFFKCREYLTGFTGSAGAAVITQEACCLWVDGRYFIQGEEQTRYSSVTLYKSGEPGVPEIHEYIRKLLKKGQTLGFDGRTVSAKEAECFLEEMAEQDRRVIMDLDLAGEIWKDRPALPCRPVAELDVCWCGESRLSKLGRLREKMKEKRAEGMILAALDDIAWLLNLRGCDVPCNPVFHAFLYVGLSSAVLFVHENVLDNRALEALEADGIEIGLYDEVYSYLRKIRENAVWVTDSQLNSRLVYSLPENIVKIREEDPVLLMKAVKNSVETENMKLAHIRDGASIIRFIIWLKQNIGKIRITELSAAEKLYEFRKEQEGFRGNSFDPIIAYGDHAAICHYSADEESSYELKPEGLLLADTGGQYLTGTTDITRTIVLGPVTEEEKKYFTLVLKGHLHLLNAKFREGVSGVNLDYLAREPLWRIGKDYNHGTGHGVGYYLNVHEGPNGFRWREMAGRRDCVAFEEGMVTSDEPGYYAEGSFGVRHENLILCKKAEKADGIQYLVFEPLTMVPFDLEGIDPRLLGREDIQLLNSYHSMVYERVSPLLTEEEKAWLAEATRRIPEEDVL